MAGALDQGWAAPPAPGYRIGHSERDHVRGLLERHTAEGRLSLDEFGDRIDEVLRAGTAADLDHALRELPPVPSPADPRRLPRAEAVWAPPRPLRAVALVLALGLFVVTVLSVIGALWPLWVLLLVGKFVFIGSRRAGPPWAGPPWAGRRRLPPHARRGTPDDPSWSSQTRWV